MENVITWFLRLFTQFTDLEAKAERDRNSNVYLYESLNKSNRQVDDLIYKLIDAQAAHDKVKREWDLLARQYDELKYPTATTAPVIRRTAVKKSHRKGNK